MNKCLLDTDILSEIGKGVDPNVVSNATHYRNTYGKYTLSVISIMEVVRGFQQKQREGRLQKFLKAIRSEEILILDQPVAELAGRIAGDLDRSGQPIGRADPMIAAIALKHGLTLVTGNTVHYQRIQLLGYSLTLVNWRDQLS
jgi:tRNA(fMet)-specific endonuclease VapC